MAKKPDEKRYEVITQEDENGDLLVPIPQHILDQLGWKEGDTIDIAKDENGNIVFKKAS